MVCSTNALIAGFCSRFIIAQVYVDKLRIDICHLKAMNDAVYQKGFVLVAREFVQPNFCVQR